MPTDLWGWGWWDGVICGLDLWLPPMTLFPAGELDTDVQSVQWYHKEGGVF